MGSTIESEVVIERPVEEVFEFFLNLDESAPRVDPELISVVKTPDGPATPGTTFRFRQKMFGRSRETTTRFTAIEPNRTIQFEAVLGPIRPTATLTFEEAGAGTRVNFSAESNPVGPFRLVSTLINRKGQREWDDRLRRVKTVLEKPDS
jgi:uncharacterized membrane protein